MEKLIIEETASTPMFLFDQGEGLIEIKGKAIPENAIKFFHPIIGIIRNYENNPKPVTTMNIQIDYFNTSSSKCILQILKILENINEKHKVILNWYYKDEDIYEIGEDYQLLIKLPFNMIEG
ncbi:MAG: DUF1987 domain-containing protein [Bacteroidales bacterium]|nr:DUF1987 domain-containing protein [Bacteroidales bacterium]